MRKHVAILLTPKIGVSKNGDEFTAEAELFYRTYCAGAEFIRFPCGKTALYCPGTEILFGVTGAGKVNAASFYTAVLSDNRFDFTGTIILNVGCGGSSVGESIMGDVILAADIIDYDAVYESLESDESGNPVYLCHTDSLLNTFNHVTLSQNLVSKAYDLLKDIRLDTTKMTRQMLQKSYPNVKRENEAPKVLLGTVATSDTYWKGKTGHDRAVNLANLHGCRHPYRICDMEDIACALVAGQFGMNQRMLDLRVSVNMDMFSEQETSAELWENGKSYEERVVENNPETQDLFPIAMNNLFTVGKVLIEAILQGKLRQ